MSDDFLFVLDGRSPLMPPLEQAMFEGIEAGLQGTHWSEIGHLSTNKDVAEAGLGYSATTQRKAVLLKLHEALYIQHLIVTRFGVVPAPKPKPVGERWPIPSIDLYALYGKGVGMSEEIVVDWNWDDDLEEDDDESTSGTETLCEGEAGLTKRRDINLPKKMLKYLEQHLLLQTLRFAAERDDLK